MTHIVVVTGGDGVASPGFAAGFAAVQAAGNAELTVLSLGLCSVAAAANVPTISVGEAPSRRGGRVLRAAANRWARGRLSRGVESNSDARKALEQAAIVWVDGEFALYAGWQIARRHPEPWVVLGPGAVTTLLANGYRLGD